MATIVGYDSAADHTYVLHTDGPVEKNDAYLMLLRENAVEEKDMTREEADKMTLSQIYHAYENENLSLVAIFNENVHPTMVPQR